MHVLERMAVLDVYYKNRIGAHTSSHIFRMLDGLRKFQLTDHDRDILEHAICYHDAVRNLKNPVMDEELSCEAFLKDFPDHQYKDEVCALIMATKHHDNK
jgi:predicted metal-dependent HD superfamily phosphohydrolase